MQLTNQLLKLVPYHQRALGNKQYFENIIKSEGLSRQRGETGQYVKFAVGRLFIHLLMYNTLLFSIGSIPQLNDEPFSTASLKLTKPSNYNAIEREKYEILCR